MADRQLQVTGLPVYAVPLHLKAMEEGSLRRRLASRILARAVRELVSVEKVDVILGGDMNAPLASGDFAEIEKQGFTLLGAQDEREGAFSYVKSPKSAIDNIFLSPGMHQTVGKIDYFIIARDRTMPDYLSVSDHRPVAMRLSLAASPTNNQMDEKALDALIEDMLASKPADEVKSSPAGSAPSKAAMAKKKSAKASRTKTRIKK